MRKFASKMYWSVRMFFQRKYSISYSQCGEDIIIDYLFKSLGVWKPSYIDIGTHHPIVGSNTYLFYQRGSQGVCIEPNIVLFKKLQRVRPRDTCLNVGVGVTTETHADYFLMTSTTLNTFSRKEAEHYTKSKSYGEQKIEGILQVPLVPINDINAKYFTRFSDLVSLDVEGLDFDIITSYDFSLYRPKVFCIETARSMGEHLVEKNTAIINHMQKMGYILYADTFINSIFVDKNIWPF